MANLATKAGVEGHPIKIETPLLHLSKANIIRLGLEHGLDYAQTVSCYQADAEGRACGKCDSCRLRQQGVLSTQTFAVDLSKSSNIQADLVKNCSESYTKAKVLSSAEASKFCKCTISTQAKMTNADEWAIQSAINAKKNPETLAVVQRTKKEMESCAGMPLIKKVQDATVAAMQKAAAAQKK
ncbi:hypothetical protein GWI33_012054 [Rhynchophorus ferrugineus]|uniref:7-cyano-7-deazaguanine synthase n=1 Tax=Rhynchophorus ferrugineus TaxID=354439 RepID=A0A834MB60_RHYFE|nr:hypothetical protein GWI33_012054 [Rhynchophorus ferrugineus]